MNCELLLKPIVLPNEMKWYLIDSSNIIQFIVFYDEETCKFNLENLNTKKQYYFKLKPKDSPIYTEVSERIAETVAILWRDGLV